MKKALAATVAIALLTGGVVAAAPSQADVNDRATLRDVLTYTWHKVPRSNQDQLCAAYAKMPIASVNVGTQKLRTSVPSWISTSDLRYGVRWMLKTHC